jgi:hypothetical protein
VWFVVYFLGAFPEGQRFSSSQGPPPVRASHGFFPKNPMVAQNRMRNGDQARNGISAEGRAKRVMPDSRLIAMKHSIPDSARQSARGGRPNARFFWWLVFWGEEFISFGSGLVVSKLAWPFGEERLPSCYSRVWIR